MSIVNRSQGHARPASNRLLSEPAIIAGIAKATLGLRTTVDWDQMAGDYSRIRDSIARVVPGFENFNERIRVGFFHLPHPACDDANSPTRNAKPSSRSIESRLSL
jgi:hypothetical protein